MKLSYFFINLTVLSPSTSQPHKHKDDKTDPVILLCGNTALYHNPPHRPQTPLVGRTRRDGGCSWNTYLHRENTFII